MWDAGEERKRRNRSFGRTRVQCIITEATLQEEYELDRMRVRETFAFGG
jgi:hypothetical protein